MNAIHHQSLIDAPTYPSRSTQFTPPSTPLNETRRFRAATLPPETTHIELAPETDTAGRSRGDPFQMYLREIGQVKLLTRDEEIALAERIESGDKEAREQMITD